MCEPLHLISIANELRRYLLLCQSVEREREREREGGRERERQRERGRERDRRGREREGERASPRGFSNARKRSLSLKEQKGGGRRSSLWSGFRYSVQIRGILFSKGYDKKGNNILYDKQYRVRGFNYFFERY